MRNTFNSFYNLTKKVEFKEFLSLATKESYFIFNGKLCKHVNGVAMGFPLSPTLTNSFLVCFEKNWLQNCPSNFKPHYYRRYVDDIFALLISHEHLEIIQNFEKGWHANMSFTIENEKQNRMFFLDVQIIRKPAFSGVMHSLRDFYHLPISLELFTHLL